MKKKYTFIVLSILLFGLQHSFAQCTPTFSDGCSIALHSFGLSYSPTSTLLIQDSETACSGSSSSGVISVTAGYTYNFDLNVFSAAGSDNTSAFFSIFLDKNNDGDFEDVGERLYYNNSTEIFKSGFGSPDYFSDVITIPADATTGVDLKFRVLVVAANDLGAGCNTDPSDACGTYCGGEIHDYTLNIAPIPICPLIFINGCSIALHNFSLASVTPAVTLINNLETSCSAPEGNPIINVKAGENYNFDLTVYSAGGSDNVSAFFSIWLDKNNDGDFADTGERLYYNNTTQIYKSGYGPPENASGSITIPTDALTGTDLKFRVLVVAANSLGDGCNTDPNNACGLYCGGEVHDYLFNIAPPDCITPNTPTVSDVTACAGSNVTLTATCATGTPSWYDSSTAITALNSGSFTINNVTAPGVTYYVACETSVTCVSNRVTQSTIVSEIPSPPTAAGQTICSGSNASLTASCTSGTAKWYDSNTSTTVLGSGNYTTPNLSTATTYFVACESGGVPNCVSTRTSQIVQVNNLPSPPTAAGQTICSGSTASLTASCTSGTAKWYDSNTSTTVLGSGNYTTPNLSTATTYFVACESGGSPNCVSARVTQMVDIVPNFPTYSTSNSPVCSGEIIGLMAGGGVSYSWKGPQNFTSILATPIINTSQVENAGIYTVTIINQYNCSTTLTVNVIVHPLPAPPIVVNSTFCQGAPSASLSATGLSNHLLIWHGTNSVGGSGSATPPIINTSTSLAANYYVSQISSITGCQSSRASIIVTVNSKPIPPITAPLTVCQNSPIQSLTANAQGSTYTILWYGTNSTGGVGSTVAPMPPTNTVGITNYYVSKADNVTECESNRATLGFTVNPLPTVPVIFANKTSLCNGETATLSASGCNGYIKWNTAVTGSSLTISLAGTYSAVCINNCGTSLSSNMVVITTGSAPYPPVISSDKTIMCDGEKATLTASGCNGKILWNTGASTSNIELRAAGTYGATCEVYCGTSSISNLITLRTGVSPTSTTLRLSAPIECQETNKTLIATGCNGIVKWNTNNTGTSLSVTLSGTYSATCETLCGLIPAENTINVQFLPNPTPTAINTGPYEIGQKIQLSATGGNTYLWRGPNDFLSTNANVSILNAALDDRGVYTVTVTNTAGCTATATSNVVINPCSQMFKYDYVKAGNAFEYFFPITNGMTINAMSINTGIIATPICQLDTVNTPSVRIQMTGPEPLYNRDIIENIYPYSPFENRWFQIFGPIFPVGEYTLTVTGYSQEYAQGNVMFGPQTIHFTIVGNSTSLTMAQNNLSEICAGSSFDVSFETTGSFLSGNIFEVQLSNANGSFEVPIKIGESSNAGIVNCQIPANIPAGNGYKTRVFATKPAQMSNSSSLGFKINPRNISLQSPTDDISALVNKKAGEKISATNKVQIGGNATYQAGRSINLEAGFSVSSGAVFKAEIGACN